MTEEISLRAPAKINLSLSVGKRKFRNPFRDGDFFHKVSGVFMKIPLFDDLRIRRSAGGRIRLWISGEFSGEIPNNDENIVYRAAHSLFSFLGFSPGIEIFLKKRIPPRSGLGGGSSDAASCLQALRSLFPEKTSRLDDEDWTKILLSLGSDVPFFFSGEELARVESFGETITPIAGERMKYEAAVLAMLPRIFSSTAWAYRELDEHRKSVKNPKKATNDFEDPVFFRFPDLEILKHDLLSSGAESAGLSGSGSSVYALFHDYDRARAAEQKMKSRCSFLRLLPLKS